VVNVYSKYCPLIKPSAIISIAFFLTRGQPQRDLLLGLRLPGLTRPENEVMVDFELAVMTHHRIKSDSQRLLVLGIDEIFFLITATEPTLVISL
jgi:hypothetical protein